LWSSIDEQTQLSTVYVSYTSQLIERSKRLIRYLFDEIHSAELLTHEVTRKLSKLSFVPVKVPLDMEVGGYLSYRYIVTLVITLRSIVNYSVLMHHVVGMIYAGLIR
jgi:hypothetical protein